MQFTLNINTHNAEFNDADNIYVGMNAVAERLEAVAKMIRGERESDVIADSNGNVVGHFRFDAEVPNSLDAAVKGMQMAIQAQADLDAAEEHVHTHGPDSYSYTGADGQGRYVAICGICDHTTTEVTG